MEIIKGLAEKKKTFFFCQQPPKTLENNGGSPYRLILKNRKGKTGLGLPTKKMREKRQICIFFAVLAFLGHFYVDQPPFFVEPPFFKKNAGKG